MQKFQKQEAEGPSFVNLSEENKIKYKYVLVYSRYAQHTNVSKTSPKGQTIFNLVK